jgi:diacylglycerol kinase (ATP)
MPDKPAAHRPLRAKLIFNAMSGRSAESPQQLADILSEMQSQAILPEVYMVRPDSRVDAVVHSAIKSGIKLVVAAGGDGTIDSVAGAMVGSSAVLGIIPTGTRNDVSFNLGIPGEIADAVALLRTGRRQKIDIGYLQSGRSRHWFLETATLGLLSDLYPIADDIQHGDLTQIGSLFSKFVSSTPSHVQLTFENRNQLDTNAYMVLIANTAYIGPRFQIAPDVSCTDRLLDVFVFSEMSKLNLISYVVQSTSTRVEDDHIKHYRVRRLTIHSEPPMPVLADGIPLEQGLVKVLVHPHALNILVGEGYEKMVKLTGVSTPPENKADSQ